VAEYGGGRGGWYQPTRDAQRAELHAAIAGAHAARHGPAAAGGRDAAALARELPLDVLYALSTPSGYVRLGGDGAPAPAAADFGGLLPFATPALYYDGFFRSILRVATVDFNLSMDSSLVVVEAATGAPVQAVQADGSTRPFVISSLTLPNGQVVPFGRSRSSPAWDRQQHVYVATDTDWDANPLTGATFPVLFCANQSGAVKWVAGVGEAKLASIGAASPVVSQGPRRDNRVYIVASDGVQSVVEAPTGATCPASPDGMQVCSGHGKCDCATATCACDGCWTGAACDVFNGDACAANGGSCAPDGTCTCGDACSGGPTCASKTACGHGGTCNPADGTCACAGCAELNAFGLCAVFNATAAACSGQPCVKNGDDSGGVCACGANTCLTGPACADAFDCGNGGVCTPGTGCQCTDCFGLGPDGTCSVENTCSGHGSCNAGTGVCDCDDACYSGFECQTQQTCAQHGTCAPATGACGCDSGWAAHADCAVCDDCHSGATCAIADGGRRRCSDHGACAVDGGGRFTACTCADGYSGADCSVPPPPAAAAPASSGAAVAAGILVPLALIAGALAYVKLAYPAGTLTAWATRGAAAAAAMAPKLGTGPAYSPLIVRGGSSAAQGASPGSGAGDSPSAARIGALAKLAQAPATPSAVAAERTSLLSSARSARSKM
jgi:hypothetical protein